VAYRVAILAAGILYCTGCAPHGQYEFDLHTPWPDEAPGRIEDPTRSLQLAPHTISWHARLDRRELERAVAALHGPNVYVMLRDRLAWRESGTGPRRLRYFDVRVGPTLLPDVGARGVADVPSSQDSDLIRAAARAGLALSDSRGLSRDVLVPPDTPIRAESVMRLCVSHNMIPAGARYAPLTIRSYEYRSMARFLAVIRDAITECTALHAPSSANGHSGRLDLIPLGDWRIENHRLAHGAFAALRRKYAPRERTTGESARPLPALPTPGALPDDPIRLRRTLRMALPTIMSNGAQR
jgi:hypothetical protein